MDIDDAPQALGKRNKQPVTFYNTSSDFEIRGLSGSHPFFSMGHTCKFQIIHTHFLELVRGVFVLVFFMYDFFFPNS